MVICDSLPELEQLWQLWPRCLNNDDTLAATTTTKQQRQSNNDNDRIDYDGWAGMRMCNREDQDDENRPKQQYKRRLGDGWVFLSSLSCFF